jgi:hypothetical protein
MEEEPATTNTSERRLRVLNESKSRRAKLEFRTGNRVLHQINRARVVNDISLRSGATIKIIDS